MKFKTLLTALLLVSLTWSQSPIIEKYREMLQHQPSRGSLYEGTYVGWNPAVRTPEPPMSPLEIKYGAGAESLDFDGTFQGSVGPLDFQIQPPATQSPIRIRVDDFYGLRPDGKGEYHMQLSKKSQTLIKLEGFIDRKEGYHRVTWKSDKTYMWSNGMATDEFKVVNPASYSKDGKVYTMFGPLPEMKGSTVVITATYGSYTDSIIIHLH
jgi:phage-related protein